MSESDRRVVAPTITIENVQLEAFEALVYRRAHEEAGRELLRILKRLKVGGEYNGMPRTDAARMQYHTRLAGAITALLADPGFELSQEGFDLLAVEHAALHSVFQVSAFETADHLLRQFGTIEGGNSARLHFTTPQSIGKLLLAYSLDSELDLDFEEVFRTAPRLALPAFLGMLANIVVLSRRAHERRERLLRLGPLFEQVSLHEYMLPAMSDAYMYCSYASGERKHDIKSSFNAILRNLIATHIEAPRLPAMRARESRPTILVPIEWFTSLHAMYRCYAPSIRKLRDKFRLVMIGRETEMDEVSKELFDETVALSGQSVALAEVVEQVKRVKPDVIYYPSLGMATWWVALSTMRLAPIQVATLGHPATTRSEAIDYVLLSERTPGDPGCLSEIVALIRGYPTMVMRQDANPPVPRIRERPDVIRVGVPSMACKVSVPFLEACTELRRASRRPLEFHFFPNMVGLTHLHMRKEVHKWIPGAIVYPRGDYNEYLRNLGQCDIHLSTFPFGGTNSNIDSMHLALPMVTLEGLEPHSQSDAGMMRTAGLPEWLITYHPAEFQRAALRLIENDEERCAIAAQLRDTDIDEVFLNPGDETHAADVLAIFEWIHRDHERIVESGRRYWSVDAREAFQREGGG